MRYSAFISYNHKDRAWAEWLHRSLERYRIPKALLGRDGPLGPLDRRLPPVFQDREELAASANLADSVREALGDASSLIVICSTNAAKSRWVNEEVRTFSALGRRDRIQCLIVPEADGSDALHPETDLFPPALLEPGAEPLAADARKSGDGKRNAFLKLVAGVAGVRYDELRQREQTRRQRRLFAIAAAASIGFILMTGLAVFALVSRAQAVQERDIARQKTITAQRTTEFVKGLFQVADPSEAKGESITVVEALDRGARQIQGELGNEPDVKAELVSTLSEVYMGLGSFRRADDLIRQSLSIKVGSGETRARQFAVLGTSRSLQGEYEQAAAIFDRILKGMGPPEKLKDPSLYSRVLVGRAEALAALERYDEARPLIRRAIAWDRSQDGARSPNVARDLEALGLLEQFADKLDASRRSYEQALAIRAAVQGRLHPKVSEDLNQLGTVAYLQKDPQSAEQYWRRSLQLDERVLGSAHPDLAATMNNLARVMIEQRKFREALPLLTRSANIYLAQRGDTHDDLAFIFSNLALARRGVGDAAGAETDFRRALRAAEVHQNRLVAPILTDLADLRCARGDQSEAMRLLDRARPIMAEEYPDDAWRTALVDNTRGGCLLRQKDVKAAAPLIRSSSPVILKRWPADALYGYDAQSRMRAVLRPTGA
jgi:tetratricopeptide (TPR) repeat protein